ncbi:parathyroid hormone/parathyroid hormone-related peptide receptor-like [Physella acuta]|uniref:parathyroid hormone/parathyroid hormone-related peptide receptor-like n=1 Tax=Physella acuta TaxID=109671 RepID=UPI0027DDF09E|nr:parathyroid hormone/parathyroid hormone-related peptide receptor-like [Physella acuta]
MAATITEASQQREHLFKAKWECEKRINESMRNPPTPGDDNSTTPYCETVWDNVLCWNASQANTTQRQPCPDYIHDFNPAEMAVRHCTPNGTWFYNHQYRKDWTNYTACTQSNNMVFHTEHGNRLKLISTVGYGISLCSLVLAVVIMCCSRRLKSKSNNLHVNLFLAFILRASISFIRSLLFIQDLGLEKDIRRLANGQVIFNHEGSHWECRLLQTVFMYAITASQMWIFVEGLYLHMLIYRTLSTERNGVKLYVALGWTLPLILVIPWIILKAVADNNICWNLNAKPGYLWVTQGPMLATNILNFFFFLNILRVLCTRVRSSQRHMGRAKYRQLAKFILVLIPLFGVFYIAVNFAFPLGYRDRFVLMPMYVEQTYNAFQGFVLALLFCFLNEEVHSEIKNIWFRRRIRRRDSVATRSFVLSSFKRSSYHHRSSLNNTQPSRISSRLSGSESFDTKQEPWAVRLKDRFLRFLGIAQSKDRSIVRAPTPPFIVRHNCNMETPPMTVEDLELKLKLRENKRLDEDDLVSSG